eukprot:gb/GEZN01006039.1/.p1 GENE.gb/GEZN01006039.1/~~gb/GEZN01006039.1/.p1  ORF type:complete len:499 (-),score=54.53 gb/GEZN01006039.1/:223-1686(-)
MMDLHLRKFLLVFLLTVWTPSVVANSFQKDQESVLLVTSNMVKEQGLYKQPRRMLTQGPSVTTTTHHSWWDRIQNSMAGFWVGLLLLVLAFPLLTYNEGTYVHRIGVLDWVRNKLKQNRYKDMEAGMYAPSPGSIVHIVGMLEPSETSLSIPGFNLVVDGALRLRVRVEMFQNYIETSTSTAKDWVGGGETETKTQTVKQKWSEVEEELYGAYENSGLLNANNPPWPTSLGKSRVVQENVFLRSYALSRSQIERLNNWRIHEPPAPSQLPSLPGIGAPTVDGDCLYYAGEGGSSRAPRVGDMRVSFQKVLPEEYSVVAGVEGKTSDGKHHQLGIFEVNELGHYEMPGCCTCGIFGECFNAMGKTQNDVDYLSPGNKSSDAMVDLMHADNTFWLKMIRLVGFLMFFFGIYLMLDPVATLLDVVSFIGSIARVGIWLVAFVGALVLTMVTVALAWLYYRPLKAIAIFVLTGLLVVGIQHLTRQAPQSSF